jgi:hypothetical protein
LYFLRKHRDALGLFDVEKWRMEQRQVVSQEKESGLVILERWGESGEDELLDWEAVAKGIEDGNDRESVKRVCLGGY